jgi:hypothetical protein
MTNAIHFDYLPGTNKSFVRVWDVSRDEVEQWGETVLGVPLTIYTGSSKCLMFELFDVKHAVLAKLRFG